MIQKFPLQFDSAFRSLFNRYLTLSYPAKSQPKSIIMLDSASLFYKHISKQ